eukprot:COSAG01_NODE_332_length_18712_cov_41.424358_17_plen_200_part_00
MPLMPGAEGGCRAAACRYGPGSCPSSIVRDALVAMRPCLTMGAGSDQCYSQHVPPLVHHMGGTCLACVPSKGYNFTGCLNGSPHSCSNAEVKSVLTVFIDMGIKIDALPDSHDDQAESVIVFDAAISFLQGLSGECNGCVSKLMGQAGLKAYAENQTQPTEIPDELLLDPAELVRECLPPSQGPGSCSGRRAKNRRISH